MKTRIIILSLFMTLCSIFSACENEAVDITTAIDITINTSSVLSPFTFYETSNIRMVSGSKIRLTCLLYDANGALADRKDIVLSDFSSSANIQEKMTDQSYTLVVVASCIKGGSLVKPEYEAYSLIGVDNLSTLKLEQNFNGGLASLWSVLGFGKQILTPTSYENVIDLEPATALVYLNHLSIHARPAYDTYIMGWTANNQMTFDKSGVNYACSVDSNKFLGVYEMNPDANSDSQNVYSFYNILPGKCEVISAALIEDDYFDRKIATESLEAGHQYVFQYDCSAATLTIKEGRL